MARSETLKNNKGEAVLEETTIPIRICSLCNFPVALTSDYPEFVCLYRPHRISIDQTRTARYTLESLIHKIRTGSE
jgi:hypothetical protein